MFRFWTFLVRVGRLVWGVLVSLVISLVGYRGRGRSLRGYLGYEIGFYICLRFCWGWGGLDISKVRVFS